MFVATCARTRCGKSFEAKTVRARYCSASCRALDSKDRRSRPQGPSGNVLTLPGSRGAGTIRSAVLEALDTQVDTVAGRQALAIADRLDFGVSDGAWAAMSKRLDELLAAAERAAASALIAAGDESDPIAFLQARGERRSAAG